MGKDVITEKGFTGVKELVVCCLVKHLGSKRLEDTLEGSYMLVEIIIYTLVS